MNHKPSRYKLSYIARRIFEYQFKREYLEIYDGACTSVILTYAKWEERCKMLLDTFFSRDGESCGIILFPDTLRGLTSQTCEAEKWHGVMSTLKVWCKASSLKDANGLIIRNYDLKNHAYFCGITNHEIEDTLAFKDTKNIFNFQESDRRILAFNPSLKIIFIIRLVELDKGESRLLQKEVDYCNDEVNLLCFLLKNELEGTGVIVTGLVAYSGENVHIQYTCESSSNNIVSLEIFNSIKTLEAFWKIFVKEKKVEELRICLASITKDKNSVFQSVASKILGYLAHLQFIMLEKPILPLKENNPAGDIKQAELLLDRYQMEIAYSGDKRVLLQGNYGTGKTVVIGKKLELLCKSLKEKEVIYYLNFAKKSPLDILIKQKFVNWENVRVMKGGSSLLDTIYFQILPKERKLGSKTVHLIADEYDIQDLSIEEANILGLILREEEQLVNSTLLIAVRPIEINSVVNFYKNGIKRQYPLKKHELGELMQIMGMKIKTLRYVMRTTVEINALVGITQAYLNNQSNIYRFKSECKSTFFKSPQSCSSKPSSSITTVSSDSSKSAKFSPPFISQELTRHGLDKAKSKKVNFSASPKQSTFSFQNASPKSSSSISVTSYSSNPAASSRPFHYQRVTADYYQLHKLIPTFPTNLKDKGSYQETVTKYWYTCESQIGHCIKGCLPRLIKLRDVLNVFQQTALIASVLEKVIPAERTVVIHFEHGDPPLWLKILFQLTRLTMTTNIEEFLTDTSKKLILVKNQRFLRGLEFSDVLLILDSNEHHLRQFIPEAIARCISNLSILIKPFSTRVDDSVEDLVGEWEQYNQDKCVLDIIEIGPCFHETCNMKYHQRVYCVDGSYSYYKVHQNSRQFMHFLKEINRACDQDTRRNYVKKSAKAKAM